VNDAITMCQQALAGASGTGVPASTGEAAVGTLPAGTEAPATDTPTIPADMPVATATP
jgi:hypothetical protein